MKITDSLKEEIKQQFESDWKNYAENNSIDFDDTDSKEAFIEDWIQENQDYYDAIIEEVDSLDEVQYLTDPLDYETYQEAEIELSNFVNSLNESVKNESVSWSYYDNDQVKEVEAKYLPRDGEGETFAQQIMTAISKLIYRYYNDGDRYDGYALGGENMTNYANWLYKYVPGADQILEKTKMDADSYEEVLKELNDKYLNFEYLDKIQSESTKGSIYNCDGPFYFEEDDYDEDEEEWY